MLQVGVHHDDGLPGGMFQPRAERALVAKIARQADELDPRIAPPQLLQHVQRVVATAVIDKDYLPGKLQGFQFPANGLVQRLQVLFFVVRRHNNRKTLVIRHVLLRHLVQSMTRGDQPVGLVRTASLAPCAARPSWP